MLLSKSMVLKCEKSEDRTLSLAFSELCVLFEKRFGTPSVSKKRTEFCIEFELAASAHGFSVEASSDCLLFRAPSAAEILYAVYDFAEKFLGFCFFEPGVDRCDSKSESIKIMNGLLIEEKKPLLKRRGFIQEFPFCDDSYLIGDWMAKNKLNYLLTHMKYYDDAPREMLDFYQLRGIEIESGHHNFNYWIPAEKYYRKHADFFAITGGKRISPSMNKTELLLSEQLCTTNPKLRGTIVKNMIAYCRKHPELKTISLVPNDGFGWCECKSCTSFYDKDERGDFYSVSEHVYKASRIYHDMVNDVVSQLRKALPDINVTFCAYVNYCAPSKGFRLEKNMAVHLAPYWRCINHAINDTSCYTNSHYADDIRKWAKVKSGGELNIYEYYMGVNLYVSLPMAHHELVFDEMVWYKKNKVDGVLTQFHLPHWTAYGLNFYLMAKAAYGEDARSSTKLAFKKLFGGDGACAKRFYDAVRKLVLSTGDCQIPYPHALFSRTKVSQYRNIHSLANDLLNKSPRDKFRKELILWTEYLLRFKELFDRYHKEGIKVKDVQSFRKWAHKLKDTRILVHPKLDMLLDAWCDAIKSGREWLHFNIAWEDAYIRKHHETLD